MYETFFGFREKPFSLRPDPRFFYSNDALSRTYDDLIKGIRERSGLMSLIGEPGSGKTTLLKRLIADLDPSIDHVLIQSSSLGFEDFLNFVCQKLGVPAAGSGEADRRLELIAFLATQQAKGRTTVLMIDEAQNLRDDTLAGLPGLLGTGTAGRPPLPVLLVGQPELDAKLDDPKAGALRQVIKVAARLKRLSEPETGDFIEARLQTVGSTRDAAFTEAAVAVVARLSGGNPRLINSICEKTLLAGYVETEKPVSAETTEAAAAELKLTLGQGLSAMEQLAEPSQAPKEEPPKANEAVRPASGTQAAAPSEDRENPARIAAAAIRPSPKQPGDGKWVGAESARIIPPAASWLPASGRRRLAWAAGAGSLVVLLGLLTLPAFQSDTPESADAGDSATPGAVADASKPVDGTAVALLVAERNQLSEALEKAEADLEAAVSARDYLRGRQAILTQERDDVAKRRGELQVEVAELRRRLGLAGSAATSSDADAPRPDQAAALEAALKQMDETNTALAESDAARDALTAERDALRQERDALLDGHDRLTLRVADGENERADLVAAVAKAESAAAAMQADLAEKTEAIASLEARETEWTEKLAAMTEAAETAADDSEALRSQLADLNRELTEKTATIAGLQDRESGWQTKLAAAQDATKASDETGEALREELAGLQDELDKTTETVADLQTREGELKAKLAEAEDAAEASGEDGAALQKQLAELQAVLDSRTAAVAVLQTRETGLKARLAEVEAAAKAFEGDGKALSAEVASLKIALEEKTADVAQLSERDGKRQAELDAAIEKAEADRRAIAKLRADVEIAKRELAMSQAAHDDARQSIAALEADRSALRDEIRRGANRALAAAAADSDAKLDDLRAELQKANAARDEARATIAALEAERDALAGQVAAYEAQPADDNRLVAAAGGNADADNAAPTQAVAAAEPDKAEEPQVAPAAKPDPVDGLLQLAKRLAEADKLTLPPGGSAVETYQKVLAIEPDNSVALDGIEDIKQRYAGWAAESELEGDWTAAQRFYRRVLRFDPDDERFAKALRNAQDAASQKVARAASRSAVPRARPTDRGTADPADDQLLVTTVAPSDVPLPETLSIRSTVQEVGEDGRTPLELAVAEGQLALAYVLLQEGADPNAPGQAGKTPLMLAADGGHTELVDALLESGADVETANNAGETALMYAAWTGRVDIARTLVDAGASIDATNDDGWTPLIYAAINGRSEVVAMLLQRGASIDAHNQDGETALTAAAWNGHAATIDLLLAAGASVDAENRDGWTALMNAAWNGHPLIVQRLLERGADQRNRSNGGTTALSAAIDQGHLNIVEILRRAGG